ncbi:hypothetical protein Cob_v004068 [Colletotrichum orbiculare MAFF 240422]|uniref:Uncharacterized protein n=1 Tax=Colletotrichum orbiculare (strain 104-T / ATCC 96160 / CBS 514.97 / LARS 414 / MAFF 240422) TaxID=1213857 RepID=A0A484FZZ6_COLOR|nr:hypothetical protein Cob_v004068 [Colletotrichum orbiculare MAFF 240422]
MPSLPHRPVLAHRDGTSSFASLHNSDVYYSNDEIAVLYDVVSAAQGNLNHLPEGERLATNALFQAYDTVLPLHGIDPEEDHHISRLVFRVGGERGDGTLMDKLRAVLSRMGIEIEFETHSGSPKPQFFQAYEGAQALPPESFSSLSGVEPVLHVAEGLFQDASKGYLRGHLKLSPPSAAPAHVFQPPSHFRLTDALPATDDPSSALREHRRPLSQIFTHSVAIDYKQRRSDSWSQTENVEQRVVSDATAQPANSAPMGPQSDKGDSISYPKKPKPVRSVNWMLPGTANEPLFDGRGDCLEQHHGRFWSSGNTEHAQIALGTWHDNVQHGLAGSGL